MIGAESQFAADVCFDGPGAFASNDYTTGGHGPVADTIPSLTIRGAVADGIPSLSPNGDTTDNDAVPDGVLALAAGAAAREVVSGVLPIVVNSAAVKHEKDDLATTLGQGIKPHENLSLVKSEDAGAGAIAAPIAADITLPNNTPSSVAHDASAQEAGDE